MRKCGVNTSAADEYVLGMTVIPFIWKMTIVTRSMGREHPSSWNLYGCCCCFTAATFFLAFASFLRSLVGSCRTVKCVNPFLFSAFLLSDCVECPAYFLLRHVVQCPLRDSIEWPEGCTVRGGFQLRCWPCQVPRYNNARQVNRHSHWLFGDFKQFLSVVIEIKVC